MLVPYLLGFPSLSTHPGTDSHQDPSVATVQVLRYDRECNGTGWRPAPCNTVAVYLREYIDGFVAAAQLSGPDVSGIVLI